MNGTNPSMQKIQLFGGAITVDAPQDLVDASDLRQVPDNQEVFLYPNSAASIIVEILQSVEPTDPNEIAKFHFDSLAHDNDARSSEVQSTTLPLDGVFADTTTPHPITLEGIQLVPKFNRQQPDTLQVLMAVFRIEDKSTDLVVTFNIPKTVNEGPPLNTTDQLAAAEHFKTFVESLRIIDFSLFA